MPAKAKYFFNKRTMTSKTPKGSGHARKKKKKKKRDPRQDESKKLGVPHQSKDMRPTGGRTTPSRGRIPIVRRCEGNR